MGQTNSRSKGPSPFPFAPPVGYYAPQYPNVLPQYGQYGMFQPVQPLNQHVVVPYSYMPPQPHLSTRRKKKKRTGTAVVHSTRRRRNTDPSTGTARFADSNPSSRPVRRAQTPFHLPTSLEDEEDAEEEEADERDEPIVPRNTFERHHGPPHHSNLPPPPEIKEFTPRSPNPLPLPPRDLFESGEYKAVMRGIELATLINTAHSPPQEVHQPRRSKTGLFKGGGLFRSLTGTKKRKDEGVVPASSGVKFFPVPVGTQDYNKLTTPTVSGAPTTASADPSFPHPPPGVGTSTQPPVSFVMAGADPNAAPGPGTPGNTADPTAPLYFDQSHPDYGGFLPHSHHRIDYNGHFYKSATHLHEALKYPKHPHIADAIRACNTLTDIFHIATSNADRAREDWPFRFTEIMEWVMMMKFAQHPNLRALLLLTGDRPLVYSEEMDAYWGDGVGLDEEGNRKPLAPGQAEGANELGQMLMRIRNKIRLESPDPYQQQ